jgi:hypothetical protein
MRTGPDYRLSNFGYMFYLPANGPFGPKLVVITRALPPFITNTNPLVVTDGCLCIFIENNRLFDTHKRKWQVDVRKKLREIVADGV